MTNFKEYFRLHLKANIRPFIYILAVVLVMTFLLGNANQTYEYYNYNTETWTTKYYATLYIPVIVLCVLVYVLPVMEFSFFKKRINLDCAYALPISRRAMGVVHYLMGLIILFGAFTASYLLNFALLLSRGPGIYNFTPMLAHYFLCLLLGFAMYAVMVFVFNRANTRGDGIWFMVLYTFVFLLVFAAYEHITNDWTMDLYPALTWGVIDRMTTVYQRMVQRGTNGLDSFWNEPEYISWFVFWVLAGIASAVGFFLTFGRRRMEKTEEISNSYFGFRTLIPIFAITGMITFDVSDSIILWVIIAFFAILGYTIYRRGFHYKKSDIAILCLLVIFLFI